LAAGTERVIAWRDNALDLRIEVGDDGMARLTRLAPSQDALSQGALSQQTTGPDAALPLVDVVLAGEGKAWSGGRYCESEAGGRLRYRSHEQRPAAKWHELRIGLQDPVTGLRAEACYDILAGQGALRAWVRLTNEGGRPVTVESVTSFLAGTLPIDELDVQWAENDWLAESRWQRRDLRDALPDLNRRAHGADPRGRFGLTSLGTWSTGSYLAMGALVSRSTGHAWAWQIEHNGAWHWQVGECTRRHFAERPGPGGRHAPKGSPAGAYLAILGPTDAEHHCRITLNPGDTFTTIPAAVAVSDAGFEGAIAALTKERRAIRRPHQDHQNLPVVFNDYMNTLMGNPTTERLRPLIAAAAQAGAEYFVIDAGWYAEMDQGWWDTVGEWKPAASRFPGGITEVLDQIRAAGMVPGLWLEPEVVGVNSPVVRRLPIEAFLRRGDRPVAEHGRYHLDLRHPAAVKHVDEVIDFVVGDLGCGYLKLDYNIAVAPGPDTPNLSPGAALLAVNRAHLDWLDAVLDRHPDLVIENCASGGMRTDHALLARLQIQSTSDQQDHLRYPPIAAAAAAAMPPEQAGIWAVPQPSFTAGQIALAMCGALLGRVHLSGHLDQMTPDQRALVAEAVRVYKTIRADLPTATPFWPLGLPRWTDPWIALGLRAPTVSYLTIWHRVAPAASAAPANPAASTAPASPAAPAAPANPAGPAEVPLPVPHLRDRPLTPRLLYPTSIPAASPSAGSRPRHLRWDPARATLTVSLPDPPAACLVALPH
jgi:alpha-galactosidase